MKRRSLNSLNNEFGKEYNKDFKRSDSLTSVSGLGVNKSNKILADEQADLDKSIRKFSAGVSQYLQSINTNKILYIDLQYQITKMSKIVQYHFIGTYVV